MQRLTYLLFIGLYFDFCCPLFAGTFEVINLKGQLEITRSGRKANPPILDGDTVKVSKGGLLILRGEGVVMKLSGETVIRPFVDKEEGWVDIIKGMLVSQVVKKKFQVRSKDVSFGVRGTTFFVSTDETGKSWMCVNEGVVAAISNLKVIEVSSGLGVFVTGNEISAPQKYEWTKGINWKLGPEIETDGHLIDLKYDVLDNIYD
jgi:hypothetical protein